MCRTTRGSCCPYLSHRLLEDLQCVVCRARVSRGGFSKARANGSGWVQNHCRSLIGLAFLEYSIRLARRVRSVSCLRMRHPHRTRVAPHATRVAGVAVDATVRPQDSAGDARCRSHPPAQKPEPEQGLSPAPRQTYAPHPWGGARQRSRWSCRLRRMSRHPAPRAPAYPASRTADERQRILLRRSSICQREFYVCAATDGFSLLCLR